MFTGVFGQPLRREWFRRTWWLPAVKRAGQQGLRFHDLRHTYVSLLIRAGANLKKVSTWAGHSTVAFTFDGYGHLYDDADDSMPDRLDALLNPRDDRPSASASAPHRQRAHPMNSPLDGYESYTDLHFSAGC